ERADAWPAAEATEAQGLAAGGGAAVAPDGMRYGDTISRLQAPEEPVVGQAAVAGRLASAERRLDELAARRRGLDAALGARSWARRSGGPPRCSPSCRSAT